MKLIENVNFENASDGRNVVLAITEDTFLRNVNIYVTDTNPVSTTGLCGIDARRANLFKTENVRIIPVGPMKRKYVYGIRAGYSGIPTDSVQFMEHDRLEIGDFGPPATDYTTNRDAISIEGGQRIRLKDCKFLGAGDGLIDSKMLLIEAARCSFSQSHRLIRQWPNVKGVFSNCTFDTPLEHLWHHDTTCKTVFFQPTFKQPRVYSNENGIGSVTDVIFDPLTDPWFYPLVGTPIPSPTDDEAILFHVKELAKLLKGV